MKRGFDDVSFRGRALDQVLKFRIWTECSNWAKYISSDEVITDGHRVSGRTNAEIGRLLGEIKSGLDAL